jgi:CRISPR-associated protein Cas5h
MIKKVLSFTIKGRYGHFCSPFTNVYRLTQPCPTKTAIMGFVGAVLGKDRDDLSLYEQLSCGVEVDFEYRTKSLPYTARKDFPGKQGNTEHSLTPVEMIVCPNYRVHVVGVDGILNELYNLMKDGISHYTPYLGLAQCVASTDFGVTEPPTDGDIIDDGRDADVFGAFIRGRHGELDFSRLTKDRHRLTEFSGLSGISMGRQFQHDTFTVNLSNHSVPLKHIRGVVSVRGRYVPIF